jgi:hypothetical protein
VLLGNALLVGCSLGLKELREEIGRLVVTTVTEFSSGDIELSEKSTDGAEVAMAVAASDSLALGVLLGLLVGFGVVGNEVLIPTDTSGPT